MITGVDSHDSLIIHLNVGGYYFSTRLLTLRAHPHSVLAQMFTPPIAVPKDNNINNNNNNNNNNNTNSDGRYFIDRNGSVFDIILDYLRTGTLLTPRDPIQYYILRREVGFYGLPIHSQLPPILIHNNNYNNNNNNNQLQAPVRYRHVRIVVEELQKRVEVDAADFNSYNNVTLNSDNNFKLNSDNLKEQLPADLTNYSLSEIVEYFGRRGYKIAAEYTHRGSKGLTSIWLRRKESYNGANVAMEVRDTPKRQG